jgi:hypothetical protein
MRSWNSKARLATPCTTSYSSGRSDHKRGLPSINAQDLHMRLRVLLPEQYKPSDATYGNSVNTRSNSRCRTAGTWNSGSAESTCG